MEKYMKAFRSLLSFTIPLIAILFSYSIYIVLDKVMISYKQSINNDYTIVVVSSKKQTIDTFESINIKTLKSLSKDQIINNLKKNLSSKSIELLYKQLPYFYKVSLLDFPSSKKLQTIKQKIKSIDGILKVEIFSKNHDTIYSILTMTQTIIYALFIIIILFSVLLLSKHIKIWVYENTQRITIMRLHGASNIYCAMPLIKVSILSAIISSTIVLLLTYYVLNNFVFFTPIYFNMGFIYIIILSFLIPLATILLVLFKHRFNA
jgi:cell division transport system permease protein